MGSAGGDSTVGKTSDFTNVKCSQGGNITWDDCEIEGILSDSGGEADENEVEASFSDEGRALRTTKSFRPEERSSD